ncbi:MAG: hypothetical protein LBR53_11765 [Deltaproteobacteria bacterium]|jgi:hypothetical protein|nr:hypothetical protein [Deltaproteobacteria bacterium]
MGFFSRMAASDRDAVIISRSGFTRLALPENTLERTCRGELRTPRQALPREKDSYRPGNRLPVKRLETAKRDGENALEKLAAEEG